MASKLCRHPGCCGEGKNGATYCEKHGPAKDTRPPASQRGYGRAWNLIRADYILYHEWCEECLKNGAYTPTAEVHHILPIAEGGDNSEGNLRALCLSCHRRITFGK